MLYNGAGIWFFFLLHILDKITGRVGAKAFPCFLLALPLVPQVHNQYMAVSCGERITGNTPACQYRHKLRAAWRKKDGVRLWSMGMHAGVCTWQGTKTPLQAEV